MNSAVFTTGLAAKYAGSMITDTENSSSKLAIGVPIGMRLPTTTVVRHCDAKTVQLIESISSNGSWRIVVFAANILEAQSVERLRRVSHSNTMSKSRKHNTTNSKMSSLNSSTLNSVFSSGPPRPRKRQTRSSSPYLFYLGTEYISRWT
jgi:hypothetical protein